MTGVAALTPFVVKPGRHKWAEPVRFQHKTERTCIVCSITKVTRHEPDRLPWVEFFRALNRIECDRTPPCEGAPT